ncbi:MAG: CHAT domain-containing protein [Planctomycetota bacterium]
MKHSSIPRLIPVLLVLLGVSFSCAEARGQFPPPTGQSGYPSREYYLALEVYRTGELDVAIDAFELALSRTRRDVNGRWIDAIPVLAMLGESQYQMGDLEGAMQSFDMALSIASRFRGWLRRPVWNELLPTDNIAVSPKQFLWPEANAVRRLPLSRSIKFYSGEQVTEQRLAQGGVIESLNIKSVDVVEVMRGLAIASYRRRIILGPLAEGDPLATQLLDATKYPAEITLPIARNLMEAMRSAERFGATNDDKAISDGTRSMVFNNSAHPISPITGLCAASAMAGKENASQVVPRCLVIANQAARLGQYEWIGEAMQLGAGCADEGQAAVIQKASTVAATSLIRESRLASLHCLLAAADAAITAGDLNTAANHLNDARSLSSRRDVAQPRMEAYGAYIAARLAARQPTAANGDVTPWNEPLTQMLGFVSNNRNRRRPLISMPRLYQLQRVRLAVGRDVGGQSADVLLARYADDPAQDVWRRDPVDAIAGHLADRDTLRVARLRTAVARESANDIIARVDDVQLGRLRQTLPIGGRVLAVRGISRLDDALLDGKAVAWRNKAPKPIRDLRAAVNAGLPDDMETALPTIANLEKKAWAAALDRYVLPNVVPKPLETKLPMAVLPPNVALLTFFEDANTMYVTLATNKKSMFWPIRGPKRMQADIGKLMRAVGATPTRGPRLPTDDGWRKLAVGLRDRLIPSETGTLLDGPLNGVEQLVVIPDKLLWYVPFELFPVEGEDSELLGESIKISYAATPSLALSPTALPSTSPIIGLTAGMFFAPREAETNASMVQSIVDSVDAEALVRLPVDYPASTAQCGAKCGHLIVGEPTNPNPKFLETRLAAHDASAPLGNLGHWLGYRAKKPSTVLLAGFRSNLDTTLPVSGNEIFQTIATLQLAGVRDVVISRWALGGESTATLIREYVQELPFVGAQGALDRAKSVLQRTELSPLAEPTLANGDQDRETLTGAEPFFWSSYLHAGPIAQP